MPELLGIVACIIGGTLALAARRLAALPAGWSRIREQHRFLRQVTIATPSLETDRAKRLLTLFWRICGLLGIVGGIALIANLGPIPRFPWTR
jgi:hypothetical protein